jgi:hypothetical protein
MSITQNIVEQHDEDEDDATQIAQQLLMGNAEDDYTAIAQNLVEEYDNTSTDRVSAKMWSACNRLGSVSGLWGRWDLSWYSHRVPTQSRRICTWCTTQTGMRRI